ncbi:MAG: hypothetical protein JF614_03595 [Acidobacteria bacterium]|nr:hypothetical protein [Acidobacteriota bacterium]
MSRIPLVCRAVALLLILAVLLPWAAAAAPPDRAVRTHPGLYESTAPFASLWSWLAGLWEKNGCGLDPSGRCLPGTGAAHAQPASADNGCAIDPWGRCLSGPGAAPVQPAGADNGCGLDPDGRCKS